MQKDLEVVISSEFLVVRLQRIVPWTLFLTLLSFCPELPTLASKVWTPYCINPGTVHI